jgi:hypothetical protein
LKPWKLEPELKLVQTVAFPMLCFLLAKVVKVSITAAFIANDAAGMFTRKFV